jgi:hypothetical protein
MYPEIPREAWVLERVTQRPFGQLPSSMWIVAPLTRLTYATSPYEELVLITATHPARAVLELIRATFCDHDVSPVGRRG